MARPQPDPSLKLAKALDGIAAALHKGRKVPKADLLAAGKAAHAMWPRSAPEDAHAALRFEAARSKLFAASAGAASGSQIAVMDAEEAARGLADGLRWRAGQPKDTQPPAAGHARPGPVAERLAGRYGRYARPSARKA